MKIQIALLDIIEIFVSIVSSIYGREVDNGFDENPHKHYIFKASAHGLNAEKREKVFNRRNIG